MSSRRIAVVGTLAAGAMLAASSVALLAQTAPVWTVPEVGAEVIDQARGLVFKVEEMDERRIVSVTVTKVSGDGRANPPK